MEDSAKILGSVLDLEQIADTLSLLIDQKHVASYYPELVPYKIGKEVDLSEVGFNGFLHLNEDFFHSFFPEKHPKSSSQFVNIAKAFFQFNEKNHVCLVQYCAEGKHSSSHFHILEEYIACIAGSIDVILCPAENPLEETTILLDQGQILRIPPQTVHYLSSEQGSITLPVKQTIKGKKDYFTL